MTRKEWYNLLMQRVNSSQLSHYVCQRLTSVTKGRAEVTLLAESKHLQGRGQLHGGWYGFIADTAGFFAVMSLCEPEDGATTLEYKINLMAAATPDKFPIVAKAKVIKRTGSLAVSTMDVFDNEGNLCASGLGTFRIFPGKAASFDRKLKGASKGDKKTK